MKTNNQTTQPAPGLPNPEKATFKLIVYFKDGKSRTFYNYHTSYDAESKRIIINEKTGLNKLHNLILFKYANFYKTAILLHKETNKQIYRYVNNRLIFSAPFNFTYKDFNILFQFTPQNINANG
jgi:hypothetical protein